MNYQKIVIATIVGAIAMFVAGFLIWGIGLSSFMDNHTTHYNGLIKAQPNLGVMFLSMIFSALLYAYIFERWAGIKTFKTGATAGVIISVLMGLGVDIFNFSYFNLNDLVTIPVNVMANALYGAIAGGVIGWVLGK